MKIMLESLRMRNFKGFKDKEINFSVKTKIKGPNEAGKSTVNDAFTWILFDKDSNFNSTFDIKPQDEFGNERHHLETEVEAVLTVDDEILTLKKIYQEKWVKPHGEKNQVFRGHTTDYFINSVPKKKKDYDDEIGNLVKEDIFKLLTDPSYFNTQYHWEERRKVLGGFVSNIPDENVIENNPNLSALKSELEKFKSVEDLKTTVAYEKKKYKKELKDIPARIDELNRSLTEVPMTKDRYKEIITDAKKCMSVVENKIIDSSSIYDVNEKIAKEISEIKIKMSDIKHADKTSKTKDKRKLESDKDRFEDDLSKTKKLNLKIKSRIDENEKELENKKDELNVLRLKFKEIQKPVDFDSIKTECPTCGQHLPENSIESKKEQLKINHINNVKKEKAKINKKASLLTSQIEELKSSIKTDTKNYKSNESLINNLKIEIDDITSKINKMGEYVFKPSSEYKNLQAKIELLEEKKEQPNETYINELKADKKEYQETIDNSNKMLLTIQSNDRSLKRINELKEKESILAQKIADLEGKEYLVEQFNRYKAKEIEKAVNSEFDSNIVQFRLFEDQVNGGLKEVCTSLVRNEKGILVPYDSANNAGQINAGLAIIKKLSEHYDFKAPIFIDNAEGVNELYETNSQHVELYVTDKGTEFKVLGKYKNENKKPKQLDMDLGV